MAELQILPKRISCFLFIVHHGHSKSVWTHGTHHLHHHIACQPGLLLHLSHTSWEKNALNNYGWAYCATPYHEWRCYHFSGHNAAYRGALHCLHNNHACQLSPCI